MSKLGTREFRIPPEAKSDVAREKMGQQYDRLLKERQDLLKELENFAFRDYDVIFHTETNEGIREMVKKWMDRVAAKTSLLKPLQQLGIRIMTDELETQPGFQDENIIFESTELFAENVILLRHVEGRAEALQHRVEIQAHKPSLREQARHFLHFGAIHPTVATLVHELIHRHHLRVEPYTNLALTEAQAYFSGLLEGGANFSLTSVAETLRRKEIEGGLYEIDTDQVIEALTTIAGLYALGKNADEIADLVTKSKYDGRKKKFVPIREALEQLLGAHQLDTIDLMALDDLYRLHVTNQRLRSQLLFYQTLSEHYAPSTLHEMRLSSLRKTIGRPEYWQHGRPVPAEELLQNLIVPADEQFPYDPNGKRTGIIFGYFPDEKPGGDVTFGIGRWEAGSRDARIDLAQTSDGIRHYLELITKHARDLDAQEKLSFFHEYLTHEVLEEPLARQILLAIINKDEAGDLLNELAPGWQEALDVVADELHRQQGLVLREKQTLEKYEEMANELDELYKLFGLRIEDVSPTLARRLKDIKTQLDTRKEKAA